MPNEKKCLRCGGTNLEPGRIQGNGVLCFRPKNAKFLTLHTGDVPVEASICTDCGTLDLVGDVRKTKSLTTKPMPV